MTLSLNPFQWLAQARKRLAGRPDTEHEQALVRVAIGVVATGYVAFISSIDGRLEGHELVTLVFGALFLGFAVGNIAAILARPAPSPARRVAGIVVDIAVTCFGMHVQEGGGAPFYLFFLWVVFGNGFRFGVRYLFTASVLSALGFGLVVLSTPYWRSHPSLVVAFLLPLLVLPLYVASLLRKLNEARARAEEASLAKSQFLANMSHEVRTPVNGILGSLDLLRRSRLDRDQSDLVQTMRLSAANLLSLLESVLDFSRLEAGSAELREEDFDLHVALQEVVRMFQAEARDKGVGLRLRVSAEVPYALHGDVVRLKQVLVNLVGNAVKFTERGHVGLEVCKQESPSGETQVVFEVQDTGVGIPPEALERIFDRFTQADASVTRRFGGAGLGLAIVQQAVALLGGSIRVESALGQGSRFAATIPFRVQPPLALDTPKLSAEAWDRPSVLLVARAPGVAGQIEQWLHAWGFASHIVSSPEEACARLVSLEHQSRAPKLVMVFGQGLASGPRGGAGILTEDPSLRGTPLLFVGGGPAGTPAPKEIPGYVAALPPAPTKSMVFNALHLALATAEGAPSASRGSNLVWFRPAAAPQGGRRLRVLLADDNATNRKIAARILESSGHLVRLAETGEAALDALESQDLDVAVLDVHMPGISGVDVARIHRFGGTNRASLPLVALTANVLPEARKACLEAGFTSFVTKPIGADELVSAVEAAARTGGGQGAGQPAPAHASAPPARQGHELGGTPSFDASRAKALAEIDSRREFLSEVWQGFEVDGERLLQQLEGAARDGDHERFRQHVQAFRASAQTVGALRLGETCTTLLSGQEAGLDLRRDFAALDAEFGCARLLKYRFFAAAAAAPEEAAASGGGSPVPGADRPRPLGPGAPGSGPASS